MEFNSILSLHAVAPGAVLSGADVVVPVLTDRTHAANLARDGMSLDQRITRYDAGLPLGWALRALEACFVKAVIAARVAGSGWEVLAHVSVHVDLEHPVSDLVTFSGTHQVLLRQTDVVWRRYISFFKISVVVYAIVVRVLDGIV